MKNVLQILVNRESFIPPYEQIGTQLRLLIASEQLGPGVLLPSVRQLARDVEVASNTIMRVYHELEHEGLVTITPRGVLVAQHPKTAREEERRQQLAQSVTNLLVTAKLLGFNIETLYAEIQTQAGRLNLPLP